MSDFNETLDALRRARGTRDDAREQLQRTRMRQLTLQRLQNKAEHREILRSALGPGTSGRSFKELLQSMPDVGHDSDFVAKRERRARKVAL